MPPTIIHVRAPSWQRQRFFLYSLILFRGAGVQFRIHLLYLADCSVTRCALLLLEDHKYPAVIVWNRDATLNGYFSLFLPSSQEMVVDRNPSTSTFRECFWIKPSRSNKQAHSKTANRLSWHKDVWLRLNVVKEVQYSGINPHFYCLEAAFFYLFLMSYRDPELPAPERRISVEKHTKKPAQWSVSINILAVFHHSDVKWDEDRSGWMSVNSFLF